MSAPPVPSHRVRPVCAREGVQPGDLGGAGEAVQEAQRAGARQDRAEGHRLAPGVALLLVQLHAGAADDPRRVFQDFTRRDDGAWVPEFRKV